MVCSAWGSSEEAAVDCVRRQDKHVGHCQGEGPEQENQKHWSVSYELLFRVRLTSISKLATRHFDYGIDGTAEFETVNGGISLGDVAGSIKGRTTNGGVSVKLAAAVGKVRPRCYDDDWWRDILMPEIMRPRRNGHGER